MNGNKKLYLSARFVTYLVDFLLYKGIDPALYIDGYNLAETTHELTSPLDIEYISDIFDNISKSLSIPFLGYELADKFQFENSSIMVKAMLSSENVEGFFNTVVKYDKYVDSAIEVNFSCKSSEAVFDIELFSPKNVNTTQVTIYLISFIILTLKKVTRAEVPLTKIDVVSNVVAEAICNSFNTQEIEIKKHCARNRLFFDREFLSRKLSSSNLLLHEILCSALDQHFSPQSENINIIDVVRREILMQNYQSNANVCSVSLGLNMTERTLHRRLAEHDTTFKKLKQQTIIERSMYYLANTNMSVNEISYEVGYSEVSAFSRAFKSYCNESPQDYRVTSKNIV
ncbi:helix-turn-helix domain-containing protein [Paraglaciecola chathamensis]|uniref:HTH araC/xylS-type domain-containing protein n=1 Tax=Paraglaciecola agarilytica NO2 TaxID=1125747 RepID=A0ABQ0I9W7_9ALTE|nr:AraC family transcriptional regulator [Paraglaciecola agarilytica]GAC06181.1 hypothetical protein GAGA_3347 [Paraglaciecola agarilytica NO2]